MNNYKEIERSIIKKFRKDIWRNFIKSITKYELVKPNDHIMVCISGGKDSFLMAKCFQELDKHGKYPIKVEYVVMNPGYNTYNLQLIKDNAKLLNLPIQIFESDIFDIVSKTTDGNPCYLCARMRRGFLYSKAQELGCNKIALGHHFNDVIETTLLSMFYSSEVKTMMPKLKSDNFEGIELIRPMYMIHEEAIIAWCNYNKLNFINCACKFTEKVACNEDSSKRQEIKQLIKELKKNNPNIDRNIFTSMENVNLNCIIKYKENEKEHNFLDNY
ncbi:MAG: ATP-binding protein [Bacilli bacterium]|nr:ATP-binding protein [Bacilli bacterium]